MDIVLVRDGTATYRVVSSEKLRVRDGAADTWVIQEEHAAADRFVRRQWIDRTTRRVLQTHDAPRSVPRGDGYWKISSRIVTSFEPHGDGSRAPR
jgi:hypothetical protein